MTEANMKKLYDNFVKLGNKVEGDKILAIPRYSKFKVQEGKKEEPISETPKKKRGK